MKEQFSYRNVDGELVKWIFVEVLDVYDLGEKEIFDGVEVYLCCTTGLHSWTGQPARAVGSFFFLS